MSPALLEPPAGQTAKVTQVITHGGTPLHVEIQQQGTRHGSRGGAGPAEQGCLLWDKNVSQSGRVSGGKQLRGEGRGPACRRRSAEQERTRRRPGAGWESWRRAEPRLRCNGIRTGQSLAAFANAIPSPRNARPLTPFGFWLNYHLLPSMTRRLGC